MSRRGSGTRGGGGGGGGGGGKGGGSSSRGGICHQWRDTGTCRFGSRCKYAHVGRATASVGANCGNSVGGGSGGSRSSGAMRICHEFQNTGSCRFGNLCKYKHVGRGGGASSTTTGDPARRIQRSSEDTRRFIKHLSVVPVHRLGAELLSNTNMWRRCWQEHKVFDVPTRRIMIEVLARTPGSSSADPPPIHLCKEAVGLFLEKETAVGANSDQVLTAVKTVADALTRLLQFEWSASRSEVKEGLSSIVLAAEGKLQKQHKDHRDVAASLMKQLEEMEKSWRIKIKESAQLRSTITAVEEQQPEEAGFDSWKTASVGWLCHPDFFTPSRCPVMKVGPSGVYDSAEDYMDTVHRLWVAMTFSEGHSALAPHCRSRGANGSCQNALWPIGNGQQNHHAANLRCRTRGCRHPVEYSCRIRSHDALCGPCADRSIAHHLGGPGQGASTHIYDAKVKVVDPDGVLYLEGFQSRNPPPNSIHWRTTRRLSAPNLVGVVGVCAQNAPLDRKAKIKWGEIVFHKDARFEDRKREDGFLAINLSSIVEFDPDCFEEGSYVAVIDCMCFVPEWVPVLRAIESQKQACLPFENGKYLNLWKEDPVTDCNSVLDDPAYPSPAKVFEADRSRLIDEMIEASVLEPIREVRRQEDLRSELVAKLENLVTETTLDRMQLVSFIDALRNPVHLTQGPPGTGKSYLGVVLVRALIMIRDLWVRKSQSVGASPILVLSYKNHAIDEFLVDLVKAEPSALSRNKLIRIGGQCKDARLQQYSERSAFHSDIEVNLRRAKLEKLNILRESIQATLEGYVSSFFSFRHSMFSEEDERSRRKASYDATDILMESVVRRSLLKSAILELETKDDVQDDDIAGKFSFLELGADRRSSQSLKCVVDRPDGSAFIKKLENDIAHYGFDHWGDTLLMWICGRSPLPKCQFSSEATPSCDKLSFSPEAALCDTHRCSFHNSKSSRCPSACKDDDSQYCPDHCCQEEDCIDGRLDGQRYCIFHACRECLKRGLVSQLATDDPPRNFCEDHPLCVFPTCLDLCTEESIYCSKHSVVKCMALTKRGKPCKGKPLSRYRPYCRDHEHLATQIFTETPLAVGDREELDDTDAERRKISAESTTCAALTKKGKNCKGAALPGSRYCFDHAPPELLNSEGNGVEGSQFRSEHGATERGATKSVTAAAASSGLQETEVKHSGVAPVTGKDSKADADEEMSVSSSASSNSFQTAADETDQKPAAEADEHEFEDEGDNLQHLREVFEVQDGEESDSDLDLLEPGQVDEDNDDNSGKGSGSLESINIAETSDPSDWTWEMPLEKRWDACQNLMGELSKLMDLASAYVKAATVIARKELQQAKIRAKARVYENKSVIGGTMVGCISRLESIRATRPFAVVVEEASEVLEPLLFSCLSESTVKLEMIGDHRQLQPSVMSHFDFEICNKINVSMFQRLIEAPNGHGIPSAVLSVQRRMRKNICDLTRNFYSDVTEIEDHETCSQQVIGQRCPKGSNKQVRACSTGGREVPGIAPHIFLWTHDGEQKRSQVGISRVNQQEASMACSLAAYLVECGVPKSSIAILTPYKGQLMMIRNMMLKDSRLKQLGLLSRVPSEDNVCRVSTVDRFQGDEEDIIIASLVVDANSKTGFVKLVNRMVVLLSRARLGMYILGNVGYFENNGIPQHWGKTLELLKSGASDDATGSRIDSKDSFGGVRTGGSIPLCCPVHRHIVTETGSAAGLRLGFCAESCQHLLQCGHACSLRCHWPDDRHNSRCAVEMDSPCLRHPGKLNCNEAFKNSPGAPTGTQHGGILSYYKCPKPVELSLPCGHVLCRPCWEEARIVAGELPWPHCNEPSPTPYEFPSCGHSRPATCYELIRFTENPGIVRCERDVEYCPPCGHSSHMKCWKAEQFREGSRTFSCKESESIVLPRCGHRHKLRCGLVQQIAGWTGKPCDEVGKVVEGVSYGPPDFPCQTKVTLVRKCGHKLELPCKEAFSRSTSLHPCREKVKSTHPVCGHPCILPCADAGALSDVKIPDIVDVYQEGQIPSPAVVSARFPLCKQPVKLIRKCGHVEEITCSQVRKPLTGCNEIIDFKSPVCGHMVKIPCKLKSEFEMDYWDTDAFAHICTNGQVPKDVVPCRDIHSISPDVESCLVTCRQSTLLTLGCGHEKTVSCASLLGVLRGGLKCEVQVSVCLSCGHEANTKCFLSKQHECGKAPITCHEIVAQKCWNHSSCQRLLQVKCGFAGTAACRDPSPWKCPSGKHQYEIKQCADGPPLDCPGCSFDKLNAAIDKPTPFTEVDRLHPYFQGLPDECIEWFQSPRLPDFILQEKENLRRHRNYIDTMPVWERTLFSMQRVPCFRSLSGKNHNVEWFDPKLFVKQHTVHGMLTKILSEGNVLNLAGAIKKKSVTLLVGFASLVRTKVLGKKRFAKNKGKMAKEMGSLFNSLQSEGYDSMVYTDEKGSENLVVWDPFPVVALCRLSLSKDQLLRLGADLKVAPQVDLKPSKIRRRQPAEQVTLCASAEPASESLDSDDENDSIAAESIGEVEPLFGGTLLDSLSLDVNWAGGIASGGVIPTSVELDLLEKMQFANEKAAPFAGIQLLRTLSEEINSPLLDLLMSAEMIKHSPSRARESFDKYLDFVRSSLAAEKVHPWALIVGARLEKKSFKPLLSAYLKHFPFHKKYLMPKEVEEVQEDDSSIDEEGSELQGENDTMKTQWEDLKAAYPDETQSDAMEELLKLTGLRKVKEESLRLWKSALQLKRMDGEARKKNPLTTNYCFLGNPGTGKTSVSRLFAAILYDSGIRQKNEIIELTAQKAKDGGTDEFKKSIKAAMDGVLFVDEAYDLDPVGDFKGKPIVNELLTLCENSRDRISVILAGYEDEFQKKFFAYNPGLKSRFREVLFEDFDERELSKIWINMRNEMKWREADGVCSVVVKRMQKMAGRKGFGNAREVRKRLELASQAAMARLGDSFSMDTMVIEIQDVIGEDPRLKSEKLQAILSELNEKIGWKRVKTKVGELIDLCATNYQRELLGKPPFEVFLNRMFLGNPGTGKTTGGKLYGRILKELGFLSNGDVVVKTASDFVGSVVGESQNRTNQILESASGKVLLIDEAYALDDSQYGKQVLDTLVEKVQGTPSDDIAVLLLGYEEQMLRMINNQNPGLSRRFPKDYAFYFDDYDDNELLGILELNLKKHEVEATLEFKEKALDGLRTQRSQSNFGNAGAVELLVKSAMQKSAQRAGHSSASIILEDFDIEDAGASRAEKSSDPLSRLEDLFRMEKVKLQLEKMKKAWTVSRREGGQMPDLGHFVFRGSPGTGKTTVARVIADILFDLGLKPSNKLVETSALDITGDFVGQTSTKVTEKLKEAKGGICFIDEAYNLGQGQYGKEACDTIVAAMTSEEFRDVLIVIAGYPDELNAMLNSNAGLKSRFTNFFEFPDWEADDCVSFLKMCADKEKFLLHDDALQQLHDGCRVLRGLDGWGNGRDVKKLWEEAKAQRAERVYDAKELEKTVQLDDLKEAITSMIQARVPGASLPEKDSDPLELLDGLYRMDEVKAKLEKMKKAWVVARREGGVEPDLGHFVFMGSPGTGKTTVARAIGNVLFGLNLKPSNKIVERSALDLTADHVGQTSTKVTDAMREAKGGIFFVDEAYNLGEGPYGKEACDTIVAAMTSDEYKDVVVVIAGYPAELNAMLNSNAGLKSRFNHFFEFPDWETEDCVSFFKLCAGKEEFVIDDGVLDSLREGCSSLKQLKGWGNGRDIKRLWQEAKAQRAERVFNREEDVKTIQLDDLRTAIDAMLQARIGKLSGPIDASVDPLMQLDSLFRMQTVKLQLERMKKNWAVSRREGGGIPDIGHFVFTGSPGTGKTTVARVIADVLFRLGLKASNKLVETSALELTGDYVGHTKTNVNRVLAEAKGGVLFVDEAYNLSEGAFGKEACDTLVAAMTSEEFRDIAIVIAGYPAEIDEMLNSNAGLKSRFTHFFEFPDWEPEDCVEFFKVCARKESFEIQDGVLQALQDVCIDLRKFDGWGNGRDMKKIWDQAKLYRSERVYDSPESPKTLQMGDLEPAMSLLLKARKPRTKKRQFKEISPQESPLAALKNTFAGRGSRASFSTSRANETAPKEETIQNATVGKNTDSETSVDKEESQGSLDEVKRSGKTETQKVTTKQHFCNTCEAVPIMEEDSVQEREVRDDGVTDEVWTELELSKKREQQRLEEMRRQQLDYERFLKEQREAEEEVRSRHEAELARIRKELEREEQERALRKLREAEEKRRLAIELEQKRREEKERKRQEELRQKKEIQRRLQQIRPCPAGYRWYRQGRGWRCGGGSHFVSDEELKKRFAVNM